MPKRLQKWSMSWLLHSLLCEKLTILTYCCSGCMLGKFSFWELLTFLFSCYITLCNAKFHSFEKYHRYKYYEKRYVSKQVWTFRQTLLQFFTFLESGPIKISDNRRQKPLVRIVGITSSISKLKASSLKIQNQCIVWATWILVEVLQKINLQTSMLVLRRQNSSKILMHRPHKDRTSVTNVTLSFAESRNNNRKSWIAQSLVSYSN